MATEWWLSRGQPISTIGRIRRGLYSGEQWQVFELAHEHRVLASTRRLFDWWVGTGLLPQEIGEDLPQNEGLVLIDGGHGYRLHPMTPLEAFESPTDAEAFAHAFAATRAIDQSLASVSALYFERMSRLLPHSWLEESAAADLVAGRWVVGGFPASLLAERQVRNLAPWLDSDSYRRVLRACGLSQDGTAQTGVSAAGRTEPAQPRLFSLPGRPALEAFFNEHVVDVVENPFRYERLGVGFPGAILLHGAPGCGKTHAVERLVEFLGWPSYSIDSSSIASPYIHETSRKIAETFDKAAADAPALLIIDEMDAFLAARDGGAGGHHRVEEVAEFLRRIPAAAEQRVLVIGMTNRLDSLDAAAVRRGRFDHIIEVGPATEAEVAQMINAALKGVPTDPSVSPDALAVELAGRPLSDVGFVLREARRIAARDGHTALDAESITKAIVGLPKVERKPSFGFIP